jgi:OmcA/MtrC family decaheme c-type cytochrome
MKVLSRLLLLAMLVLSLGLMGCEGDDGDDGATGATGATGPAGPAGQDAVVVPLESCAVCHAEGAVYDANDAHVSSSTGSIAVSNVVVTPGATDLVVTFNVKVNGSNKSSYYDAINVDYRLNGPDMTRKDLSADDAITAALTGGTDGNYTITLPGAVTSLGTIPSRYLIRIQNTADAALASADRPAGYRALVTFDYPSAPDANALAGGDGCANCHGSFGNGFHYGYPSYGGKTCTVCHDAVNVQNDPQDAAPPLAYMTHGIHASEQVMPSGKFVLEFKEDGIVEEAEFMVTYPSYMNNCSVCHGATTGLTAANGMDVTWDNCMSCHENMKGFPWEGSAAPFEAYHLTLDDTANCASCHDGGTAPQFVTSFHNGSYTERGGLIWNGQDVAVVEGAKIATTINSVARSGSKLVVKWAATYNGTAVDPCYGPSTDATKPSWKNASSSFTLRRSWGQGDDWVNADMTSGPGQPPATGLVFTDPDPTKVNTVCASNVATTTVTLTSPELASPAGTNMAVALEGKPNLYNANVKVDQEGKATTVIGVRAKVAYKGVKWAAADGVLADYTRRAIADVKLCLKCHVGSLYQHGGGRVDSLDHCMMCHNEASSEQNRREADGISASEAYDGQAGQTYGFKSLLHAIHSTGSDVNEKITEIYRTIGVYVWAPEGVTPPNWPTLDSEGGALVYGSSNPQGTGPNKEVYRPHNLYHPTYPRNIFDCSACHVPGGQEVPDQSVSVATTVNTGASYGGLLDDTLRGTGAAACTSCHSAQAPVGHAYQNGWDPKVFENGRQTIIDAK